MDLKRRSLRWFTILAPMFFILVLVIFFLTSHPHAPAVWLHNIVMVSGLGLVFIIPFSFFVFSRITQQEEEIIRRSDAMAAINTIGTELTGLLDLESSLQAIIATAKQILKTDAAGLCLADESGHLIPRVTNAPPDAIEPPQESTGVSHETNVLAATSPFLNSPEESLKYFGLKEASMQAYLTTPLRREGKVIGAMCVANRMPRRFSPMDVEFLTDFATLAAVAIENARLHEQIQSTLLIEERHRIAREMHDGLAQDLGFLLMKFAQVEEMLAANRTKEALPELSDMKNMTREAYEEVRQSIYGLRSMVPRGQELVATLSEYLKNFSDRSGIAVDLKVESEEVPRLRPSVEAQAIRIIQEALSNVRKHSNAKRAMVTFYVDGNLARILVQDNGTGFDIEKQKGSSQQSFGLETMRERAEGVGGAFTITSEPGGGTMVEARLPLG